MTQYDPVASLYHNVQDNPYYSKVINPSLVHMLGDVKGKSLLDLACGDGERTQFIQKLGPKKVVGVDISQGIFFSISIFFLSFFSFSFFVSSFSFYFI